MRRLALVVMAAVLVVPGIARADDDLAEMLESAGTADFQGRGIVLSSWEGASAAATYEVSRRDGTAMVSGGGIDLMVGAGVMATRSESGWYGLEIDTWSAWDLSDRYTLAEPVATERLGRPAEEMRVMEGSRQRALVVVDADSGVPLLAEIYDGSGGLFRMAALIEFRTSSAAGFAMPADGMMERIEVAVSEQTGGLPAAAGWYRRADVYAGPEGSIHAFYTDGLFSFSVFEQRRTATPEAFRGAGTFTVGGKTYRRILDPSQIWVHWHAPDTSYVLVGDLPPDHLSAVLGDLPKPGERSFFVRLWRWMFG